jgi:hypothetical protein
MLKKHRKNSEGMFSFSFERKKKVKIQKSPYILGALSAS